MIENCGVFLGTLMQSRNQAHIYHLQSRSYAQHVALNTYYDDIVELIDSLAESIQGRYGIIKGYKSSAFMKEDEYPVITYFEALCKYVESARENLPQDSYIQNQVDEAVKLIEITKFKLINLK